MRHRFWVRNTFLRNRSRARYGPTFSVAKITNTSVDTTTYSGYSVGYNWINGTIPADLEIAGGIYFVKAFDGATAAVAVTDNYLKINLEDYEKALEKYWEDLEMKWDRDADMRERILTEMEENRDLTVQVVNNLLEYFPRKATVLDRVLDYLKNLRFSYGQADEFFRP